MKSMRKKVELPEVEPVTLHPILGIRPGVIILSGIILAILLLSFLLFVLPGLVSNTGYVRFNTNTVNTSITTDDGKYIGSSEGSLYRMEAGDYTFVFSINGVEAGRANASVTRRVFFTLFTHRADTVTFTAENTPELESAVKESFAEDVAAWSAVIDYDDTYHFPPLFSSFARNAVALGFVDVSDALLYGALHITSKTMYSDYLSALSILSESGVTYLSEDLESLNETLEEIYTATPSSHRTIKNPEVRGEYENGFFSYDSTLIEMGNDTVLSYSECNTAPVKREVGAFSISESPVTEYEYALFVEANPYWSASNREQLIEDGMADEGYLKGIVLSSSIVSSRPIRSISYYAAEAYCAWLSEEKGEDYHLASEAEWYTAALSSSGKGYSTSILHLDFDTSSPSSMMGGLWEMTDTPYIPLMRLSDYDKAIELSSLYPYDGIIVKGGSYINSSDEISIESVGVVEKNSTSPFIGFRVAK